MKVERIDLYEYYGIEKPNGASGYLDCYIIEKHSEHSQNRLRPAMLVNPGGAYAFVSAREGEPIAIHYLNSGYQAFVLNYSVCPISFPYQLLEGCMAICYVRENASRLNIDKEHVGAVGFSAGGHLTASIATLYNHQKIKEFLGDKVNLCRPDAVILSYPVIAHSEFEHKLSIDNVSGNDETLRELLSLEKRVNKDTPPAFIWTTSEDETVPCENSLVMAMAYKKAGVPFELHVFEKGIHGLSRCDQEVNTPNAPASEWLKMSNTWLSQRGFGIKD